MAGCAQVLGTVIVLEQGLESVGVITIHWDKAAELFAQYADVNGDGKVDKADAEVAIKELEVRSAPQLPAIRRPFCVLSPCVASTYSLSVLACCRPD